MDLGLSGRVALITGSSQGIGQAIAERFASEGSTVAITYRNSESLANAVVDGIRRAGGQAEAFRLDLGSPATIEAALNAVIERFGRIDVLVNNAVEWGARPPLDSVAFEQQSVHEWQMLFRANIEGASLAIHLVIPIMKRQGWGRIVTMSSAAVELGVAGAAWYSAAKAALHGLTRSLARELDAHGVLVNVVMPGPTLTPRVERLLPIFVKLHRSNKGARRMLDAAEIAPLVVYLASAANTAVNGQQIIASGAVLPPVNVLLPPTRVQGGASVAPPNCRELT
jgi:3-oxoacyl-[acyl-carrier protein] reductase